MLLVGDIGGTKTDISIFSPEIGLKKTLADATFYNAHYPNLETIVNEFLSQTDLKVEHAIFGVAGPVLNGQSKITNLPWVIDEKHLQKELKLTSVRLLNDLEAIANAIPVLESEDIYTLNKGVPQSNGIIAVIAPGTGLGEAFLTWNGSYQTHVSEGGHADFAPTNQLEIELLSYLSECFGHVSYERVCSGQGLSNIYAFLKDSGRFKEPTWLTEKLSVVNAPAPVISNIALNKENSSEICQSALNIFISILGAEAGNLALKVLAMGGVYIGGGIPPRILPALKNGIFMKTFQNKGRMSDLLVLIPVHVILNLKAALIGAAYQGFKNYSVDAV